ncbi:MAG: lipopolysaccharide biosynthesis protein [Dysgonomonas sp.]
MAGGMKSLAKDTAVYGMSSIVGKFLNWCLVPIYTRVLTTGEYGVVTNIYAYIALVAVLLTYGMETGFFRFIHKEGENPLKVYSTTLISIATSSLLFIALCFIFINPISNTLGYSDHRDYIGIMAIVIAIDAFTTIPFAYLRYKKMPVRFATLKLVNIILTIFFNIFFLIICPAIYKSSPEIINWFYDPNYREGYIFVANLLGSLILLILLIPYITGFKYTFDNSLLKQMLKYSFPLLILGIAGILNQNIDKIIYPFLFEDKQQALESLGVYGACARIAVVMMMFTQAFRFAYEPFVFAKQKDNNTKPYGEAMKYFIIFSLVIFLGVMFYIDILKYFVGSAFFEGINVVPIIMLGYIFFGIYFNLSFWYKLTDKTYFGAVFSTIGCVLTIAINIIFVPVYGYMASAWASLICNLIMMLFSYYFGQKNYPIHYDLKRIGLYFLLAAILYCIAYFVQIDNMVLRLLFRTILFGIFLAVVVKKDLPLSEIPIINKLTKKK